MPGVKSPFAERNTVVEGRRKEVPEYWSKQKGKKKSKGRWIILKKK